MNNIVKTYVYKDKIVFLLLIDDGYVFRISSKTNKDTDYYSLPYESIHECENESYKVCKSI